MRLRYWRKFILMEKSRTTKIAYSEEIKKKRTNSWAQQTKQTLIKYKMGKFWRQQLPLIKEDAWNSLVEKNIKSIEEQDWNNTRINSTTSPNQRRRMELS